jgi:AcrR family transcriptional regulator
MLLIDSNIIIEVVKMNITQDQKAKTRNKIIRAAVEVVTEKGFRDATMHEIAKGAKVGGATIYSYFPTKESIVYGYFEDQITSSIDRLKSIEGFDKYTFQEQIQTFFDTQLELFLPDREFVHQTFRVVFFSIGQNYVHVKPIRNLFHHIIDDIFQAAIEVGEIPHQPFAEISYQLFWDYYVGLVSYWLNDTSPQFTNTTLLVDKTLDLACAVLKAGIPEKVFGMASFLFRNHVLSKMDYFKDKADTVRKIKRQFMEQKDVQ